MKSILKPTQTVNRMKTKLILATAIGLALNHLNAQSVPTLMSYQGKVTDNGGVGIGSGTATNRQIIFRIFDAPTGGNRLWSEQQTVTLSDGEFSVLLGQGIDAVYSTVTESPRPALNTVFAGTGARYVEIVVDGGDNDLNAGDTAITPRQRIISTAYAFRATTADSVANGSDLQFNGSSDYGLGFYNSSRMFSGASIDGPVLYGLGGGALGSVNGATQTSALRWNAAGAVAVGTPSFGTVAPSTKFVVQGDDATTSPQQIVIRGNTSQTQNLRLGYNTTGNWGSIQAFNASASALSLNPLGGYVGIGTSNPTASLQVLGGVLARGGAPAAGGVNNNGYAFIGNSGDNDSGLFSTADGRVSIYTDGVERISVTNGTTTVNNSFNLPGGVSTSTISATGDIVTNNGIVRSNALLTPLNNQNGMIISGTTVYFIAANTVPLQMQPNAVGINGAPDSRVVLRVNGGGNGGLGLGQYGFVNAFGAGSGGSTTANFSVWADGRILCSELDAFSDARIKKISGVSDAKLDLSNLMQLKITDYTYLDTVMNGKRLQKKLIAQEVEKVFPQAVSQMTNVVPDIMKKTGLDEGWISLATDLKKGERVRILADGRNAEVYDVLEVKKDKFLTSFKPTAKDKDGKETTAKEVFVYGREVKDFRTVDYDAIAMLNVSATQQLKKDSATAEEALRKENEALRKESEALRAKVTEMEKKIASTDKASAATEARLAALEKALSKEAKPAARTASFKAGE